MLKCVAIFCIGAGGQKGCSFDEKFGRFGVNGDCIAEVVALTGTKGPLFIAGCPVSNLVIARPVGTLPEALALRFLDSGGPDGVEGDACGDGCRGAIVVEIA